MPPTTPATPRRREVTKQRMLQSPGRVLAESKSDAMQETGAPFFDLGAIQARLVECQNAVDAFKFRASLFRETRNRANSDLETEIESFARDIQEGVDELRHEKEQSDEKTRERTRLMDMRRSDIAWHIAEARNVTEDIQASRNECTHLGKRIEVLRRHLVSPEYLEKKAKLDSYRELLDAFESALGLSFTSTSYGTECTFTCMDPDSPEREFKCAFVYQDDAFIDLHFVPELPAQAKASLVESYVAREDMARMLFKIRSAFRDHCV